MRYALLSVYDKTGLAELAWTLAEMDYTLVASEGTQNALIQEGLKACSLEWYLSDVVGYMLDLIEVFKRDQLALLVAADLANEDSEIDLVYVNMKPATDGFIDLGGSALLRAAVKADRIVLCGPEQCAQAVGWLSGGQKNADIRLHFQQRAELAVAAAASYSAGSIAEAIS